MQMEDNVPSVSLDPSTTDTKVVVVMHVKEGKRLIFDETFRCCLAS